MEATIAFMDDRDDQPLSNVAGVGADGTTVYVEFAGPRGEVYGESTFHNAYVAGATDR